MKKRKRKDIFNKPAPPADTHFENLIELRAYNPQGYARLGEGPHRAVEEYEMERLASTFERRDGTERLLELRERLPDVFERFSDQTKQMVDSYSQRKQAYETVIESIKHQT
jgi:hypothetical protein